MGRVRSSSVATMVRCTDLAERTLRACLARVEADPAAGTCLNRISGGCQVRQRTPARCPCRNPPLKPRSDSLQDRMPGRYPRATGLVALRKILRSLITRLSCCHAALSPSQCTWIAERCRGPRPLGRERSGGMAGQLPGSSGEHGGGRDCCGLSAAAAHGCSPHAA